MRCHFSSAAFVCFLSFCTCSFTGQARECPLVQKSDLLQFRNLIFQKSQSVYCKTSLEFSRPLKIASWNTSTSDCCTWNGINLGCNPLRSSSMYSSRLLSINTNDRLSNDSFHISPHKTSTSPSLLFQNLSKLRVHIFDELDMSSVDLGLFTKLPLSLRVLSFHSCKLQGYFPVEVLDLGMSMSNDVFPSQLDTMPNLQVLVLLSNQFHGTLNHPGAEFPFPQLRILHISFNKFFGLLAETHFQSTIAVMSENKNEQKLQYLGEEICYQDPAMVTIKGSEMQLGKILSIFSTLDFSSNSFEGPILNAIGNLISIKGLNHLLGTIPSSLSKVSELDVIGFLGVGCLYGVVFGLIIEGLLCKRWHHAIERGFEFFTWSFTPTRSTINCYFRSTKQNPMNRGPFVAFAVVVIVVQFFDPAASTLILQNQCSTPIAICNIDASGPIYVKQRDTALMELSGSLVFWAHKDTSDTICTMENPAATMVEIDVSSSSQSYKVSVENGFNLGIKIMALGGIGCPIAACSAKLTDCPDVLKVRSPNNVVIACNPPNCSKSKELCSLYTSLMGNSLCQKPGLSYEPSTIAASCALSIDLVISFTCG